MHSSIARSLAKRGGCFPDDPKEGRARMRQQDLSPAPRGRLEKLQDANVDSILLTAILLSAFLPLQESIGFWPAFAVLVPAVLAAGLLVNLLLRPLKRKRIALDAEQGLFECAHREQGSPLKRKWALGYAKAEPGKVLFQAKTGVTGSVAGPVEIYSEPRLVSEAVKAPWTVFPKGSVVVLSTNKGSIELAASPSSLNLLTERALNAD